MSGEPRSKNLWALWYFKFFKMWTFFKSLIRKCVIVCFCLGLAYVYGILWVPWTRDQTCTPALKDEVLTIQPLGTSLWTYCNKYHHYCYARDVL